MTAAEALARDLGAIHGKLEALRGEVERLGRQDVPKWAGGDNIGTTPPKWALRHLRRTGSHSIDVLDAEDIANQGVSLVDLLEHAQNWFQGHAAGRVRIGTLRFQAGRYQLDDTWQKAARLQVVGLGQYDGGTRFEWVGTPNVDKFMVDQLTADIHGGAEFTSGISGIQLSCNHNVSGISGSWAQTSVLRGVHVQNPGKIAFDLRAGTNALTLENCFCFRQGPELHQGGIIGLNVGTRAAVTVVGGKFEKCATGAVVEDNGVARFFGTDFEGNDRDFLVQTHERGGIEAYGVRVYANKTGEIALIHPRNASARISGWIAATGNPHYLMGRGTDKIGLGPFSHSHSPFRIEL